jgi:hypothetical protein
VRLTFLPTRMSHPEPEHRADAELRLAAVTHGDEPETTVEKETGAFTG